MEVKKDILWRVYLTYLGLIGFGLMIIGKAFYTQRFEGGYWKSMSDSLHTKIIDLDAERGTIFSEDGSMLSTSIPEFDIYIDFGAEGLREKNGERFFKHVDTFAIGLSQLFQDKRKEDYVQELKTGYQNKDRYYLLRKKVPFAQYKIFREFKFVKQGRNKSGVIAEVKTKRLNPFGELGFRTIGLYRDHAKLVGLERSCDTFLRGTSGKRLVRYVAGGVLMPVEGYEVEPENGYDVYTTLDVNIQDIAQRALLRKMQTQDALEGTCIVMEVSTGKIKAMANFGRGSDGSFYERDNYAIRPSEPGSTIKLVTTLIAIEHSKKNINDPITVGGRYWNAGGFTIDEGHAASASMTIKEGFARSSNIVMSKLAYENYQQRASEYYHFLKKLRLTRKTGIELKEEFFPGVPDPSKQKGWQDRTLAYWGFGYGLNVSPLQLLTIYNAIANKGKMMKPYLVNEIRSYGTVVRHNQPEVLDPAIASPSTIAQLHECLLAVCTEGTARDGLLKSIYSAAGKTGTAKVSDGVFKYTDLVYQSSFAGYFPADNPRYSIIVVIKNKPGVKNYYAAQVAVPVFREIADHLYKYVERKDPLSPLSSVQDTMLYTFGGSKQSIRQIAQQFGIPYKDDQPGNWRRTVYSRDQIKTEPMMISSGVIPDVTGLGLKDAMYILETAGFRVRVTGRGKVVQQSVPPGNVLAKGEMIQLNLN